MVPQVTIRAEYHLTNPPTRIGFGVFDEQGKLIGVLTNEHFESLIKKFSSTETNYEGSIHFRGDIDKP